MCPGKCADIGALDYDWKLELLRGSADQPLIGLAAPAAEKVIQMGHAQSPIIPPGELVKHVQ